MKDFSNFKKLKEIITKIDPDYLINCLGVTKFHNDYKKKSTTKKLNVTMLPDPTQYGYQETGNQGNYFLEHHRNKKWN